METEAATRDLILDAAEELFARQGFDSTTIKQIGARADANPALIYYYFGSKDTLYRAVLSRLFEWLLGAAARRMEPGLPPDEAVRTLIDFQSGRLRERPTLPRILAREMIDPHAEHAAEHIGQLAGGVFRVVCQLIEQGQKSGLFRPDLDPRFCAISAVSLVPYTHIVRPAMGVLLDRGPGAATDDDLAAYARHAAAFVLSALEARRGGAEDTEEG
ncbi:TetR/AcrR family transcriptional regulator [Longimicrobium sp.]|uniref:TetR/AcrR family transcriptional regulator n=1 Tax=Longimicrobium sp. TaxID=2029185 RepID=UPI002BA6CC19|nr:TetR/AcrR family transcriptional regulator [Longimicrobium sp.]HSU15924.1 TetR/AcrR family transcriptional regulator [Longimicrobium sp.]